MLTRELARFIINRLGETGTPPEFGLQEFSVGLDSYLKILEEEYLDGLIKWGGSSFKLVLGSYGGGKTHFLYLVRDLAFRNNYAVSYIPLSPVECPFNKLELVYKSIMANLMYPIAGVPDNIKYYERGIDAFIKRWYSANRFTKPEEAEAYLYSVAGGIESSAFANAVKAAYMALNDNRLSDYDKVLRWLKGEEIDMDTRNKFGLTEHVDRTTALRLMRSLVQWVKGCELSGVVFLYDEAERSLSISTSKERRQALDNLRHLIDECGHSRFPSVMIYYAIPDEHQLLEAERGGVYEALKQRLSGYFKEYNPSGVRIELEKLELTPLEFLQQLGKRLAFIYEVAYQPFKFASDVVEQSLEAIANECVSQRYADIGYRRLFVKTVIKAFHLLRSRAAAGGEVSRQHRAIERKSIKALVHEEIYEEERRAKEESSADEF